MTVQIEPRMAIELIEKILIPNRAYQSDSRISGGQPADFSGVAIAIWRCSHHNDRHLGRTAQIATKDQVDIIFRLEPSDQQVKFLRLKLQVLQPIREKVAELGGSVWDELGLGAEFISVIVTNPPSIGDERVGPANSERLCRAVEALPCSSPLRSAPLQTINVNCNW